MSLSIDHAASVDVTSWELVLAKAGRLALNPLACANDAVWIDFCALSMAQIVGESTSVTLTIRLHKASITLPLAIEPLACVVATLSIRACAFSVVLVVCIDLTDVLDSVLVVEEDYLLLCGSF